VRIVLGTQYTESVIVLKILAFLPFIVGLSNVFGIQTMLTLNFKKAFSNILISASFLNLVLALILVSSLKHIGISISVLISEIFVTLSMYIYLKNKGIKILEGRIV
jgi:PST family polysaccharide transporter